MKEPFNPYKEKNRGPWRGKSEQEVDIEISQNPGRERCFVATVAFGNPDAPEVKVLRSFRDNVLMRNWFGKGFINVYYFVGPHLATAIGSNLAFRKFSRSVLRTFIKIFL